MRNAPRIIIVAALLWVAFVIYHQVKLAGSAENPDPSKVVLLFGAVVLLTVGAAAFAAFWLLPLLGERIGNAFFNPGGEMERGPHADALAKVALGDYVAAIHQYQKCYKKDPDDVLALSEMAHLYCDKLEDYDSAAALLEEELKRDWPADQGAFLAGPSRGRVLAPPAGSSRARKLLLSVAESMPETRHSANALHRLREIDRAALLNSAVGADPETAVSPDDTPWQPAREPEKGLREAGDEDSERKQV